MKGKNGHGNKTSSAGIVRRQILPPRFKIEPLSLIVVNLVIFVYLWKILPALFDANTLNQVFAITAPIVFLFAGAFYAWWTKKILYWQIIITVFVNLRYYIEYGNLDIFTLVIFLMFYFIILRYGGYIILKHLEKSGRFKGEILYSSPNYKYKIFKYIDVLIVLFVINTSLVNTFTLFSTIAKFPLIIGVPTLFLAGCIIYGMMKEVSFITIIVYIFLMMSKDFYQIFTEPFNFFIAIGIGFSIILLASFLSKYINKNIKK